MQEATEHYNESLNLWQYIGDRRGQALAKTALGGIYSSLGDKQLALDFHGEALKLFRQMGNHQGEAAAVNGIAQAYEDLSEYNKALQNYQRALDLYQLVGNRDFVALNTFYIGRVYSSMKEKTLARTTYMVALDQSREVGDRQIEAHILKGLGLIDSSEGHNREALKRFRKVLELYAIIGDNRGKAYTLNGIGHLYYVLGERKRALAYFQHALPIVRAAEDRKGEALTLYNLACVERDSGDLDEALAHSKESVGIIEASRTNVDSKDLRTSYFAEEHKHYELYIDLLMQLSKQRSRPDYAAAAFLASEQARARSLLEVVNGENRDEDRTPRARLFARSRELARILDLKTEYKTLLLSGKKISQDAERISEEILRLSQEYESVRSQIIERNPRHSTIAQPEQTTLTEIRAELRTDDTMLLEFSLGEERSYLWAVDADSIHSYELPGRAAIENAANSVYGLLTARQPDYDGRVPPSRNVEEADSKYPTEAAALSRMLFSQVAAELGSRRLLIVSDGGLHEIPFDALPIPTEPGPSEPNYAAMPLMIDAHEVVQMPSASILVALRGSRAKSNSPTPNKTLMVLADPVYDEGDPRVAKQYRPDTAATARTTDDAYLGSALRSVVGDVSDSAIPRLPASLKEAKAIIGVVRRGEGTIAVGFDASRARVMSDELKDYRIVHFATHGILNLEHPETSGLILSMVDEKGDRLNGYLRLSDIYGLDVPADLVVLSACRTGLGHRIQGEGVIGLARGFMYAGSKSIVASLWKVDDEATAALMTGFYTSMLKRGLPPAAALRAAKQELREKRLQWRSPFFWAAFVLEGEYTESLAQPDGTRLGYTVVPIAAAVLLLATVWALRRRRMRLRGR